MENDLFEEEIMIDPQIPNIEITEINLVEDVDQRYPISNKINKN
jgi:hypothetical protein